LSALFVAHHFIPHSLLQFIFDVTALFHQLLVTFRTFSQALCKNKWKKVNRKRSKFEFAKKTISKLAAAIQVYVNLLKPEYSRQSDYDSTLDKVRKSLWRSVNFRLKVKSKKKEKNNENVNSQ